MKGFKKLTEIILCAAVLFALMPTGAFAVDEANHPYCEIKFRDGCDAEISQGETTEIYLDYYAGEYEEYQIVWTPSRYVCEIEYVTDESTGFATGAKITSVKEGMYHIIVELQTANGGVIANDIVTITSTVPDNRPFTEKLAEWFNELPANMFMGFFVAVTTIVPTLEHIIKSPIYAAEYIAQLIDDISNRLHSN